MNLVTPDIGLIFWSTVTFIILLVLLRKFAWKPILEAVKSREQSIEQALASADQARKDMQNLKADNERILAEARATRETLLKEARELREKMIGSAKEQAQLEADKIIQAAKSAIESERQAAVVSLKKEVAILSVDIAEKLLRSQLEDKKKQLKLVDEILEEVKLN